MAQTEQTVHKANPPSIVIREAGVTDAGQIARVHVDTWKATYRGILSDEFLDHLSYLRIETGTQARLIDPRNGFTYVAETKGGEIVGFASGGPRRDGSPVYEGELYAIYILPSYQGMDIGRRFVKAIARRLRDTDMNSMLVWVITNNPARGFYERLGGKELSTATVEFAGSIHDKVSYGWLDTSILG